MSMDGSDSFDAASVGSTSTSSYDELSTLADNTTSYTDPVQYSGHHYGRTSLRCDAAHLGDTHITHNYFRSLSPSLDTLRAPYQSHTRHSSHSQERNRKWFVPRPSTSYFTGRRIQLRQLKSDLMAETVFDAIARKVVVVVGLGGSGKTQLCLKFAEESAEQYWGVFWIDASNRGTAELGWSEIGSIFGRGPSAAAGKHWLSQIRKSWLLILDNADSDDLDITSLLPSGINGHIIINTRRNSLQEYATAGTIRLDRMDPDEAINLLLNAAYSDEDSQRFGLQSKTIAQSIAQTLDYLAIALHQAGKTIRCKICTLEKYLSTYSGYRLRPPGMDELSTEIITTWEIPFQRLESKNSASYQDAVAVFHLLAFLHHHPVHEFLLRATWHRTKTHMTPPILLPDLFQGSSTDFDQFQARLRYAVSILYEHSIIEFDPKASICSVHPVIHKWARERISQQGKTSYWLICTLHVLACASLEIKHLTNQFNSNFLQPHMDSFLDYARKADPTLFRTPFGANCAEAIASAYERAACWHKALEILETVIVYRSKAQGVHHDDTLRVKRTASLCYWNLFQIDRTLDLQKEIWIARWWSRQSLFDWAHPYRPQHIEYGIALNDLTQSLWLCGQLALSRQSGERAVYILRKRLGYEDTRTVDATFNLARTCRHLGLLQQAHNMLIHVRRRRRTALGLDHPDTLMVRNEIGMNLCTMGYLNPAERTVRNVLIARERILGAEHAYTLWSVNDLSKVLCARDHFNEAVQILEDIIPAVARTLGEQHVGMHMTKGNLARALACARRWNETEIVLKEMLGDEHLMLNERVRCLQGLSRIQTRLDKLAEAKDTCGSLLTCLKENNAKEDRVRAMNETAGLLMDIYTRQGNIEQAHKVGKSYPDLVPNVLDQPFELT